MYKFVAMIFGALGLIISGGLAMSAYLLWLRERGIDPLKPYDEVL